MTSKKGPQTKVEKLKEALEKRRQIEERKSQAPGGSGRQAPAPEIEPADLEELTRQLVTAEEEAKAHYDKLLRVMAELDNFKKRSERERREAVKYSNEQLIADLLPVLDDMDRVLDHVPEGASKELLDFVSGVQLAAKQFAGILGKYGLSEVMTEGEKFNPEFHEAMAHISSDKVEPDYIIEQHRKGYLLNDRVIRAAMVSVSKGKE